MHNFTLVNADTDSISFCKATQEPFTEEEQNALLKEINSLLPEKIKFEHDGIFKRVIVLRAKNYILWDGEKIKQRGSSLKSSTLEIALKEMLGKFIETLLKEQDIEITKVELIKIYNWYIREADNVTDIKRWSSKKTLTEKIYKSDRANETKILSAVQNTDYVEGDKVYVFFKQDDTNCLVEKFDGDYNKDRLFERVYKCTTRFDSILPTKEMFLNYSLKRNKSKLEGVLHDEG